MSSPITETCHGCHMEGLYYTTSPKNMSKGCFHTEGLHNTTHSQLAIADTMLGT